jgi:arabinose-5-phosphate isomerase
MPLQVHQPAAARAGGDRLAYARQILRAEASVLDLVAQRLDAAFEQAVDLIRRATQDGNGRVAITGTGKSADVGQKIAGTLNSTETRPKRCTAISAWSIPPMSR